MTIMSSHHRTSLHFYVRGCRSTSDVNCGCEPCQITWSSTHLSSFMPFPTLYRSSQCPSCHSDCMHAVCLARDDHYLTRSKFNSLLTEMITPQTTMITECWHYIYIHRCTTLQTRGTAAHSSVDKANALNNFFYGCYNQNCPPNCITPQYWRGF